MTVALSPIDRVLEKLPDAKRNGSGWIARCPAHDDRNPSLSISEGDDGRVLLHCHAGCSHSEVLKALGLTESDLFVHDNRRNRHHPPPKPPQIPSPQEPKPKSKLGPIVATYDYHDATGSLAFQVTRHDPKTFLQRIPNGGGGWIWKSHPQPRPIYRLPHVNTVSAGAFVFVVEGEKDTDRLANEGLVATTIAGGAEKAHTADLMPLHGRDVVILPDNDDAGRDHARQLTGLLDGEAASLRVVELEGLPAKGDVSDWLDAGHDAEELVRLAEEAELWAPTTSNDGEQFDPSDAPEPELIELSTITPTSVSWLWPGRIAEGKLTLVAGDPGLGKSFLTIDLASRVSTGTGWPDFPGRRIDAGDVVLLSAEDSPADTIVPRLMAAGADLNRVKLLKGVIRRKGDASLRDEFDLTADLDVLRRALSKCDRPRLVIVDPVSAYLGRTDSHVNAEVRRALAPLGELAEELGVAIVAVSHLNKGSGGNAVYRVTGSLAFTAAARAVFVVTRDDLDHDRRLLLPVKNNLGPDRDGLAYTLRATTTGLPSLAWEAGPVTVSANDALGDARSRSGSAEDDAAAFLREALQDGPLPANEIKAQADQAGHAWGGAVKRAKSAAGVESVREGGQWIWRLKP